MPAHAYVISGQCALSLILYLVGVQYPPFWGVPEARQVGAFIQWCQIDHPHQDVHCQNQHATPPFLLAREASLKACILQAVARHSEKYQDLPLEWQTQTLMTVGATEALAAALMGLLNRGDEVCTRH